MVTENATLPSTIDFPVFLMSHEGKLQISEARNYEYFATVCRPKRIPGEGVVFG